MDERRKRSLRRYHQDLRTGIVVGNILPALRPVLTDAEYSRIRDREDNTSRVDELIDVLLTKENRHYDAFCTALEKNGYEHWAKTLQREIEKLEGPEVNAPPLSQTQVQFPIIDDLADDFAILIVNVDREVHSLSASRLQGLRVLVEEKLKSKGAPIKIPGSADELISTISQYWDYLSFEFAQLVVRYLGKKDLQTQMKRYEENLQKKAVILLTHCRENNVTPSVPPGCFSMKITMDEDPYSFSLHRILEFKDFLVHRMGMNIALFTGCSLGSIFLHFCILEDDMETAVRQLYEHKLELRAMQVVAIEVGDVLVYCDTPIAVSSKIDDLAVAIETGGLIVSKVSAFGSAMSAVVGNALGFLRGVSEEVKNDPQVKTALSAVKSFVEIASCFLDKVVDIFYYCQSDAITAAIKGLSCSVPDLMPLRILMGLLGKSLAQAVTKYSELEVACNAAIRSCNDKELHRSHLGKRLVVAAGVGSAAIAGAFMFGLIGLAVGAAVTVYASRRYLAGHTETAFSKISGNFDTLKKAASDFRAGVTHVHATVKNIATQVGNIYGVDKESVNLMIESLEHLKMACAASYGKMARGKEDVRSKTRVLTAEI